MRRHVAILLILGIVLAGCVQSITPVSHAPGPDEPFPPTWTPTVAAESTATATLVVHPTPTWDGTLPPPSEAEVPRITPARLYRESESGKFQVVDLRIFAEYNQAHIAEAVHVPFEELADRLSELDGNKTIVFYDQSPSESMSLAAAMYLYGLGFTTVSVLDGGLPRWYSEGYPIEGSLLTPTPGFVGQPGTLTPLPTSTPIPTVTETPTHTPVPVTGTVTPTVTPSR
jgi:rhodanese-related sulfurtransferase